MRVCATCYRLFPEGGFCPIDGKPLVDVGATQPPTDPEDPRVGKSACGGRYQLWRVVADGGMGRVYQALDTVENRTVALKILHKEVALDPVSVERFKREFDFSSNLPHDHIVEVLGFERTEDESWALVMEYLEGEELRTLLKRDKTMSPEAVIRMMSHVAIGLSGAHEKKIVHRDLKPDNVFICHEGEGDRIKILDFGSVRDNSEGSKKLTVMGTTIGSPFYMSPEQAQGLPTLDHRADVWALAAIAYECLTGTVPFSGSNGPAILLAILTQDPKPPSEVGASLGVPRTLDDPMEMARAKSHELRHATIGALVDAFGHAYGLDGDHHAWAKTPAAELKARIEVGLPQKLAGLPDKVDFSAMDAQMAAPPPGQGGFRHIAPERSAGAGDDEIVMGVKPPLPKWVVPVVAGVVVLCVVGIVVAFVAA
jgi:serine/threonine protein kinase